MRHGLVSGEVMPDGVAIAWCRCGEAFQAHEIRLAVRVLIAHADAANGVTGAGVSGETKP